MGECGRKGREGARSGGDGKGQRVKLLARFPIHASIFRVFGFASSAGR